MYLRPSRQPALFAWMSALPSFRTRVGLVSGEELPVGVSMNAFIRYGMIVSPVSPLSGTSSALPLPLGSFVLKARSTSRNSSVVVGCFSPSFFSHSLFIHSLAGYEQWKQSTHWGIP